MKPDDFPRVGVLETIEFLNDLLKIDYAAVYALVEQRVSCNRAMADHPTVQVTDYGTEAPKVGLLGVLNGLFGTDAEGWGPITAIFEDDGTLSSFRPTHPRGGQPPMKE